MNTKGSNYKIGNYRNDSTKNRGWFVGVFLDENDPAKTKDVEIKYSEFDTGPNNHPMKTSKIFECSIILEGKCEAVIDDHKFVLNKGDYVVIQPNTPNNIVLNVIDSVKILTIKAPSDPTAKKIVE